MEDREITFKIYRNALTIFNLFVVYTMMLSFDFDFLSFDFNKIFTELGGLMKFFILIIEISLLIIFFNNCRIMGALSIDFDFRVSPSCFYWNINKYMFIINHLLFFISFFVTIYRLFP